MLADEQEERVGRHSTVRSWTRVTSMSSPAIGREERAESRARRYGRYDCRAERMLGRLVGWAEAGRRLCDFRAERRTARCDVAVEGREGCVVDVR